MILRVIEGEGVMVSKAGSKILGLLSIFFLIFALPQKLAASTAATEELPPDTLATVPQDLQIFILSDLNQADLLKAGQACKSLWAASGIIWRNKVLELSERRLSAKALLQPLGDGRYRKVRLSACSLNDWHVSLFRFSPEMSVLDLSFNSLGVRSVHNIVVTLKNLRILSLIGLRIGKDGISELVSLTSLKKLYLGDNDLTAEDIKPLRALTGLEILDLWKNNIGDEGLQTISFMGSLKALYLGYNGITGEGLGHLSSLQQLTELFLGKNKIGDEEIQTLSCLPRLKILSVWGNTIRDQGARVIGAITSLTSLNLSLNEITSKGFQSLSSLCELRELNLSHNNITGSQDLDLSGFKGLTSLDLSDNHLSAPLPSSFKDLTSLTSLDLRRNKVSDSEGERLSSSLTRLVSLRLK